MDNDSELADRITDLTARIEALERRLDPLPPAIEASGGDDPLWILGGLRLRVRDPGAVVFAGTVRVAAGPVEWQMGVTVDALLKTDWRALSVSLTSLGNPVRLGLLQAVMNGTTSSAELAAGEGMGTTGQLYHHLNQLVSQGWLRPAGRGCYAIPVERVVPLLVILSAARSAP